MFMLLLEPRTVTWEWQNTQPGCNQPFVYQVNLTDSRRVYSKGYEAFGPTVLNRRGRDTILNQSYSKKDKVQSTGHVDTVAYK